MNSNENTCAGIYVRALEGPAGDLSIGVQSASLEALATRLGVSRPLTFADRGPALGRRPALAALMAACSKGELDLVLVASREYLERDRIELGRILVRLRAAGVRVIFVSDTI